MGRSLDADLDFSGGKVPVDDDSREEWRTNYDGTVVCGRDAEITPARARRCELWRSYPESLGSKCHIN